MAQHLRFEQSGTPAERRVPIGQNLWACQNDALGVYNLVISVFHNLFSFRPGQIQFSYLRHLEARWTGGPNRVVHFPLRWRSFATA